MKVAILAGGLATRLRPISETIPKSLLEIAGRPFIFHQLDLLRSAGITDAVLCVGHLGERIEEAVGDGSSCGVRVTYSHDGDALIGTGGALRRAQSLLGELFFVLYGDSYLDVDYLEIGQAFRRSGRSGLMTVFKNQGKWDTSNVVYDGRRIVRYDKSHRDPQMEYIDYGLGVLNTTTLSRIPLGQRYDLADLYRALIDEQDLAGFEVANRFYEMGSHAGLEETSAYLLSKMRP